jgi:hypothetical protein
MATAPARLAWLFAFPPPMPGVPRAPVVQFAFGFPVGLVGVIHLATFPIWLICVAIARAAGRDPAGHDLRSGHALEESGDFKFGEVPWRVGRLEGGGLTVHLRPKQLAAVKPTVLPTVPTRTFRGSVAAAPKSRLALVIRDDEGKLVLDAANPG